MVPLVHMTQETALTILKTGANVFLTGAPGAGKTFVINQYIAWLEAAGLSVAVTASTGIAATHIGGLTIHSWSGIGTRDTLTHADLDHIVTKEHIVKRLKRTHVLIIDEISMLDGTLLDMVNVVLRTARGRKEAFGGLQVILVGDFYQLPPVRRVGDVARYAFESRAWDDLRPLICYVDEQHRQSDELLLGLLSSIRRGEVEEEHYTLLNEQTSIDYEGIEPTRLYTHNADVDAVNLDKLNELRGMARSYKATGKGSTVLVESLLRNCLSPALLTLKEDAMVMCTKNNFEGGYANGTLARVVSFSTEGHPIIETADKRHLTIEPTSWEVVEDGKVRASIEQYPLRLAWAITVHKSQGMSLDAAEMDLSKSFVYGQGYVALSRVRSLAGLKVLGVNATALQVDPRVIGQDERFVADSLAAEETFAAMEQSEIGEMHERFVKASGGKMPSKDAAGTYKRTKTQTPQSTYEETKKLFDQGLTIEAMAAKRGLTTATIISHIEYLIETNGITKAALRLLLEKQPLFQESERDIQTAFSRVGTEALKPVYDELGGAYEYPMLRLVRCLL